MKILFAAAVLFISINLYAQPDVDSLKRRIDTLESALKEKNYMRVPVGDLDKTLDIHVQSEMLKYLGILIALLITGTFSVFKILQKNVAEEVKGKYATLENEINEFNKNLKTQINELSEDLKDKLSEMKDTWKDQLSEFKETHKRENDRQDITIKTIGDSIANMRSRQESFLADVSKDVEQKISEATSIIWNDIADNKIRTVKDLNFKGPSLAKELNEFLDNPSVKLSTEKKQQLVDALMRCFYYTDNKDLKTQGFDTNYNEMAKLLKKCDGVLELLPETYATAAIAFNNIYEMHHMPEDKRFCIECCDKSLNKSKDYGEAFAVKLEVYAIDYLKAFDDQEKERSKEALKRIFHEIKVSRSNYLQIDTLMRLYIDRNVKNLKVYIDELEKICCDEMLYMKEKACINIVSNPGEMKREESKNLFFQLLSESSNANKIMNGKWKTRKSFKAGEEIPADKLNIEILINQYAFTLTDGAQSDSGYIQFLPYTNGQAVNFYLLTRADEYIQTAYCLSSTEADGSWRLCSNYNNDTRPAEFLSTAENGYYLDELVKI